MNELTTTTPADTFRAMAAERLIDAANMSLHELVDEFMRLTEVMDANVTEDEHGYTRLNDTAGVAERERKIVVGTARARFGLSLDGYDRPSSNTSGDF